MTFNEAYSTNAQQIRCDRDHYLAKARAQRKRGNEFARGAMQASAFLDTARYARCLKAARYHLTQQDAYVHVARQLNWRLVFCLKQKSLPV